MRKSKRIIAIIISFIIIISSMQNMFIFGGAAESNIDELDDGYSVGDIIEFGSYPQTHVTNTSLINTLNGRIHSNDWIDSGSQSKGNHFQYVDKTYNGTKYRAIRFSDYKKEYLGYLNTDGSVSTQNYQEINGYYTDTVYWFEFEPLKWQVLDAESGLVISKNIIDAKPYNETCQKIGDEYYSTGIASDAFYANSYYNCTLRSWLVSEFYNVAFSNTEKEEIISSYLNNKQSFSGNIKYDSSNSTDKVFVPSSRDITNVSFGFNSDYNFNDKRRIAAISDYSFAQGCYPNSDGSRSYWWVRNFSSNSNNAGVVLNDVGKMSNAGTLYSSAVGVRPAIRLNFISDSSEKISIDRSTIYSDSSFINYGSQKFYDSLFEYSNNGMEAYNNRSNTTVKSVDKDFDCPTNSKKMIQIETNGVAEPGLGGFVQPVTGQNCGVYYHIIIAKIPKGYRLQSIYNTLYYDAEVNYLTSTKGTGKWELYIIEVKYGLNISNNPPYSTNMGHVYLTSEDGTNNEHVTWCVGYSNVFDNAGTNVFPYGAFGSDNCSVSRYNNNAASSDTVSVSRVTASSDCPTTSGYMMKVQTDPGTTSPGLGGFYQGAVTPEKGKVYYHKILAKIPKGYYIDHKANKISANFEWITDNKGTGDWETYIYKVTVDKNASDLGSFGFVALFPNDVESGAVTTSEQVVWYVSYSNIYWNYEFSAQLKASDLNRGTGATFNGHSYIRYDYPVSWHMAKAICEKLGGHLATITSTEENNAIASLCSSQSVIHYWIGATDKAKEGVWKWITREPFSYNKWSSGQPDNYNNGESFLEMWTSDGYWNDNKDSTTDVVGFICEFDNSYIPVKTIEINGHLYSLFNDKLSWTDAEAACVAMGGHLVSITSSDEQLIVENLLKYGALENYWIGATDKDSEGVWKWIDTGDVFWRGRSNGTSTGFSNWNSGEPNNNNDSTEEDYAHIYNNGSTFGKWNDSSSTSYAFICEVDTNNINYNASYCYNGNKYEIYDKSLSWTDAKLVAEMKGGHLVTITSSDEQDFINSIITGHNKIKYLIGATDYSPDYSLYWRWVTGEKFEYSNWQSGNPDFSEFVEFFAHLRTDNSGDLSLGEWNDTINAQFVSSEYGISSNGFIIEYDNYYSTVAFDENNDSEINYFIAPTIDDGWTLNNDGTLFVKKKGITITYNPSDETFTFDSNGASIPGSSIGELGKCPLYSFDLFSELSVGQYLTLSSYYVSGSMENSKSCLVLEGITPNKRCATDIISDDICFNSTDYKYPSGPLNSEQVDKINQISLWLYDDYELNGTIKLDNYKLKFSVNITDDELESPQYSRLAQKVLIGEQYGEVIKPSSRIGYNIEGYINEKGNQVEMDSINDSKINQIFYASWSPLQFNLMFDANGGNCETACKLVYYEQPYDEMPVPSREGYIFLGWYTKKKSGTVVKPTDVFDKLSDLTLYACWAKGENNSCGENLSWILDGNRLIISGTGDMSDYDESETPWSSVINYINSIEIQDGVTGVGNNAFNNMTSVRSVEIADTVKRIGEGAFESCLMIEAVEIPDGVKLIGDNTFKNCLNLKELSFPYSVTEITDGSLDGCNGLQKITVYNPKCVMPEDLLTSSESITVYGYTNSTSESFADDNDFEFVSIGVYGEQDNVLWIYTNSTEKLQIISNGEMPDYSKQNYEYEVERTQYSYSRYRHESLHAWISPTNTNSKYSILETTGWMDSKFEKHTTKIRPRNPLDGAVDLWYNTEDDPWFNEEIQTVVETYTDVRGVTPWKNISQNITCVEFSEGITYIGDNTLFNCTNVKEIKFPKSLNGLGNNVLEGTQWFDDRDIGIVMVGSVLYAYKQGVEDDSVVLSKGVTGISENFSSSFISGLSSPTSIQISNSVINIDDGALSYAKDLKSLTVNAGNLEYKSVNNVLYSKDGTKLICYPAGLDGKINIPESVTEIAPYAFAGCEGLTELKIGRNVMSIADTAFDSTGLTTVYGYYGSYAQTYAEENGYGFVPYTSTVTFDCNDDAGTVFEVTVNTGCPIGDLYVPGQEGYSFVGWYLETDDDDLEITSEYIVNEDITIYAYWEEIPEEIPYITGISILHQPVKMSYYVGDVIDSTGMELVAQYSNGETEEIINGFYCVPSKLNVAGNQSVTVTYSGFTTEFNVNVTRVIPVSLTITKLPDTVSYFVGQRIQPKGLLVTVNYNNGTQKLIKNSVEFEYVYDFSVASNASTVNVYYQENDIKIGTFYQVKVSECPVVYADSIECNSGDEIMLPIKISGNTGLMGYIITVSYDPEVMTPSAPRTSLDGFITSDIETHEPGVLKVIWYNSSEYISNGELFKIPFKINSNAQTGEYDVSLSFSEEDTFNKNFDNVLLECLESSVSIQSVERGPIIFADNIECSSDNYVDIPIYFDNNVGILDASYLTIVYDTSALTYSGYIDEIGTVSRVTGQTTGRLKLRLDELSDDIESGCLLKVRFYVTDNAANAIAVSMSIDDDRWATENFSISIAESSSNVAIYSEAISTYKGDTIVVPVYIKDNSGIMGYQILAQYDNSKLELVNVNCSDEWKNELFDYAEENGVVSVIWTGTENVNEDGLLFELIFNVNHNASLGYTNIYFSYINENTFDEKYITPHIDCYSCQLEIKGKEYIVPFNDSSTEINYSDNYICNITTGLNDLTEYVMAVDGYTYSLEMNSLNVGTGTKVIVKQEDSIVDNYTVILFGDVNGDGWYDGMDAIIVSCLANGVLTKDDVTEAQYFAADCNHDGIIDDSDVQLLEQAGVLLASVDQSMSEEVLLETSSAYVEYLNLVEQSVETETTEIVDETSEEEMVVPRFTYKFFDAIIAYIKEFIVIIKSAFTVIR